MNTRNIFQENIVLPEYNEKNIFIRKSRSFVIRRKMIKPSDLFLINKYWNLFGITFIQKLLQLDLVFNSTYPVIIDIGFGSGGSLVNMAMLNKCTNFLGIEVYIPGIYSCLRAINKLSLSNIKIIYHDAIEVIKYMIPNNSIHKIQLFFPDPWHKKKHHKRRIITDEFIKLISKKLVNYGFLHIKTDSKLYVDYILKVINYTKILYRISLKDYYRDKLNFSIPTKFEIKNKNLGHSITNLVFIKNY